MVCAAPSYLRRAGRPETPADLSRHACLIYTQTATPETWRFQGQDGRTETVHVPGPLTSTNPAFVHRMALAGHGVVRGPTFSLGADCLGARRTAVCRARTENADPNPEWDQLGAD
jgi:DNA-binding transcriptional LysR family regulator